MLKRGHLPLVNLCISRCTKKTNHEFFRSVSAGLKMMSFPFFQEHADSVYLRDLNNGFDRMLLHAVCQYLNLISKSMMKTFFSFSQNEFPSRKKRFYT